MYVITFYSFKGGVGRTLALANVGAHLALQGKSVLLVDFDLEAPGLDSFPAFRAHRNTRGIVEFVTAYIETGVAPIVSDYVANCEIAGGETGRLTLMRSGISDRNYSARLGRIDWQKLYSEQDGFLLFEDLKAQWRDQIRPDYVLIDSRTGHTDVGGICTRQLPDAVVACFIPNQENIGGLETVAADIRNELSDPNGRPIDLHFVVSNVPYLDDENRILAKRLSQAKRRLGFERPAATIHRYESLSLLNNEIFVQSRSRTRLAKEYRQLATVITNRNLEDREVALRLLNSHEPPIFVGATNRSLSRTMEQIQVMHSNDGEVLHSASRMAKRLGREDEARLLLQRAKALGFRSPETILDSAQEQLKAGQSDEVLISIEEALNHPAADYYAVSRAVELCLQTDPNVLHSVGESVAFRKLRTFQQAALCEQMLVGRDYLPIAERILRSVADRTDEPSAQNGVRLSIMLCLIGQGKFEEAALTRSQERPDPSKLDMASAFNYAIAEWGMTHTPPSDFFGRVLELGREFEPETGKNIWLCLSISAWVVGELETAVKFYRTSVVLADRDSAHTFSGWRYLQVSPAQFGDDLRNLGDMLDSNAVIPQVLREHWR
jgi:MinD-like ATPase involved in chromosome partitioning or flagellar assembly